MAYRPVLPINSAAKVAASTVPAAPPTQATVPLELPHERDAISMAAWSTPTCAPRWGATIILAMRASYR